jgi:hypothetical protein
MATSGLMFLWAAPSGVPSFNANCSSLNSALSQPQIPDQPNLVGCPLLHRASPPTHSLRPLGACPCPQWGIILPQSFGQRHTSAVLFSEGLSLFSVPPRRQTALMPLALSPSPLPKVRINIYLSLCWTRFAPVLAFCPTEGRPNIACTPWRSVPAYSFYPWKYNAPLALFHSSAFLYSSAAYFTASLLTN